MIEPYEVARRLGLDADGRLQRSGDGLSDARRAHPASHKRRPTDGSTSVSDVQAVSRHLLLQNLGVTRPGPGVRSCGGRVDAEAALGHQENIQVNFHSVCASHREAAIFVYQQHGRLYPKLWVESDTMIVMIEPRTWDSCDVTDWQRTQMLSACLRSSDGLMVGRTDEVYIRDMTVPGAKRNQTQDLASMVDFDPSIRSALMIHAVDLRTTETYLTMATFDLDNEGLPFWERHETISYYERFAIPLWAAAKLSARRVEGWKMPRDEADDFCEEQGWIVTRLQK